MALWNLAARDELAVQPASRHVADLLLAACNLYVDLTALQTAFMKQLRPFYSLYADAEHARRATEEEDLNSSVLRKRRWAEGGSESANSAASTPCSAASTPTGRPWTASRHNDGPPEDDEISQAVPLPELAIAAEIEAVPRHLRGNRPAAAARGPGIESQRNGVAACRKGRGRV
jgi:hypothetical protein